MATSPTLKIGASGPAVTEAKSLLNKWLASVNKPTLAIVSVQFDADMDKATKEFQAAKGLKADGIIGPMTWGALRGTSAPATAPAASSSVPPPPLPVPTDNKKKAAMVIGGVAVVGILAAVLLTRKKKR
jgi:hypothetical protein